MSGPVHRDAAQGGSRLGFIKEIWRETVKRGGEVPQRNGPVIDNQHANPYRAG